MDTLGLNLIFEILRYEPKNLFIIECLSPNLFIRVQKDPNYIHRLLEKNFDCKKVRFRTYQCCKWILR